MIDSTTPLDSGNLEQDVATLHEILNILYLEHLPQGWDLGNAFRQDKARKLLSFSLVDPDRVEHPLEVSYEHETDVAGVILRCQIEMHMLIEANR